MIGIIIAFLLGYLIGERNETKQGKYIGKLEYNGMDYGYVRDGESVKDLS